MGVSRLDLDDLSLFYDADIDTTVEADVMDGPCRLKSFHAKVPTAESIFVRLFDNQNPTFGSDKADFIFKVLTGGGTYDTVLEVTFGDDGVPFNNGLSFGANTLISETDTTAPTATCFATGVAKQGVS